MSSSKESKQFHVDLAFDLNAAPVGLAAGVEYEETQKQLYPLQFAIVDSDNQSWFPIGDPEEGNGGFAGRDSFDLRVYDITRYDGRYLGPSIEGTEMVVYCSTLWGDNFDPFSSKPSPSDETAREGSWGWIYETGSDPTIGESPAYGNCVAVYEVEDENGIEDFVFNDPAAAFYFKIGFAWKVSLSDGTQKVFVYDPEWIVNTSGG